MGKGLGKVWQWTVIDRHLWSCELWRTLNLEQGEEQAWALLDDYCLISLSVLVELQPRPRGV